MIADEQTKQLLEQAKQTVVHLNVYNVVMPYTLNKNLIPGDHYADVFETQSSADSIVTMYNLITQVYDTVYRDMIGTWKTYSYMDDSGDVVYDTERSIEEISRLRADIDECVANEEVKLDHAAIIALRCDIHMSDNIFELLKKYNLKYTMYELCNPTEQTMQSIREDYMNIIRTHRAKAFEELDQMEEDARESGATEEDLADIDTIKQMFRDIPADVDLSGYKSIPELYEFWPSLLLPKPSQLLTHGQLELIKDGKTDQTDELDINLLNVTDVNELKKILSEMGNLNKYPGDVIRRIQGRISYLNNYT